MRQDDPRHLMARDAAWNLIDYIPGQGAPARERGGWSYASPDLSSVRATASYVQSVAYAPFAAGAKLCVTDEDGELYTVASTSSATDIGALTGAPKQNPVFHRDNLIFPSPNGTSLCKRYTGSVISTFSPTIAGQYAIVYKDRSAVANSASQPQRIHFSDAGALTYTASGYIDCSGPINAVAALRNAVLLWSPGKTERLRGATPPPSTDMILEPVFDQGCLDARSVANHNDFVVFANARGVFMTDGAVFLDLTRAGGMSQYWRSLLSSYTSSWTISAGVYRGFYIVSLMNGATFQDCLACDIDRRTWFRMSNLKALCFGTTVSAADELYFGSRVAPRLCSLSSLFSKSASVKNDADGTAVTAVWETAFTPLQGKLRIRDLYVSYDLRDAASDDPTLTISYLTSPESSAYTVLSSVSETSAFSRQRVPLRRVANGFGFKLSRANASSDARLYSLELDGYPEEASRV